MTEKGLVLVLIAFEHLVVLSHISDIDRRVKGESHNPQIVQGTGYRIQCPKTARKLQTPNRAYQISELRTFNSFRGSKLRGPSVLDPWDYTCHVYSTGIDTICNQGSKHNIGCLTNVLQRLYTLS